MPGYIGRFARSIESNFLGKVVAVEHYNGELMLKMKGVNQLTLAIAGGDVGDHLDEDDVQWFTPEDVRFINIV